MKYVVKDGCIGCGACEAACPEIFFINDEGLAEARDIEVPADIAESAEEAMDGCPVGVIEKTYCRFAEYLGVDLYRSGIAPGLVCTGGFHRRFPVGFSQDRKSVV